MGLIARTRRSGSGAEGVGGDFVSVLVADDDVVVAGVGFFYLVLEAVGAEDNDVRSAGALAGEVDGVAVLDHPDEEPVVDVVVDWVGVGIGCGEFLDVVEPCVLTVDCGEAEHVGLGQVVGDGVGDVDDGVAGSDCHDVLFLFFVFVYTLSIAPVWTLSIGVSRLTLVVLIDGFGADDLDGRDL